MNRHIFRIALVLLLFIAFFIFRQLNEIWYTTEAGSVEEARVDAWINFFVIVIFADVGILSAWMIYEDVKAIRDGQQ